MEPDFSNAVMGYWATLRRVGMDFTPQEALGVLIDIDLAPASLACLECCLFFQDGSLRAESRWYPATLPED